MLFGINVAATTKTIFLKKNQEWTIGYGATRTRTVDYVSVRCYAVYPPEGGEDTYTRIQAIIRTPTGKDLCASTVLYENATKTTPLKIKEGYLNLVSVNVHFRGNNPIYTAEANVYYSGN
ncbi:MAG: hypothetical protein Q4F21_09155 [Lachnospiraceae bacterium]|nr:hypothetical protein [Lachnospiraceae bacterium]